MNRFLRALIVRGVVLLLIAACGLLPASISVAEHVTEGTHFSDVGENHPEMRYIAFLSGKGIIGGYPDGRFGPGDALNRAAATKIAVQVAGMTARQSGADPDFTDLAPSHWSVPFVRAAVESRLVTGFEDKTFRPDAPVTRAQLAALAVRATRQSTERVPSLDFKDASPSDWFYRDAALAVAAGMMDLTDGNFRPNETATRAEAARAFAQAMMFTPQVLGRPLDPEVKASRGRVEVLPAGTTEWVALSGSRTLPAGSRVRTGAASAAELLFPDGSGLYLDNLSELIIHKSLGVDLVGGSGVEELDVELVKGQVYAALTPRISEQALQAYKGYLAYYAEDKAKDNYVHETLKSIIRTRSASSHSGENLPAEVTGLMLFVDPASLEPGDAEGAELTIVLVNAAGEPVTATQGPVTIELASDLGRFSNSAPVILEGYQAVSVQFFPPEDEPEDAKTRVTALAGEISTALTIPTAKTNWWQGLFSKKTRAKVRMPWSVASVRGSYVLAQVGPDKNSASFLAGGGTQRSLATGDLVELSDNQSSSQEGPDQPPGNSRPLNPEEQTQFSAQRDWIEEQAVRIQSNAPHEVSREVRDENNRVKNLVVALPPDTVNPSVGISSPAGGTRLGTNTVTIRGAASDDVKLASVTVNGSSASVDANGQWSAVVGLSPGSNTIVARAADSSGNSSESSITVTYDAANPSISLSGPTTTKQRTETYSGSVSAPGGLKSVTVNGQPVTAQGGSFSFTATLEAGRNLLVAEVTDQLGRTARSELEVTSASEPPLVTLGSQPSAGGKALITISGQAVARYAKLESVSINGKSVLFNESGTFADLVKLELGSNTITVEARDSVGNVGVATLDVNLDAAAPQISVSSPRDSLITKEARVTVSGTATAAAGIRSLTVNGQTVTVSQNGAFSTEIPLQEGENAITVEVTEELGRKATDSRTVIRVTRPPALSISQPASGERAAARNITVSGSAAASFGPLQRVTVNGQSMLVGADGGFSTSLRLENGENTIAVEATDSAGNQASEQILVTFNPANPSISVDQPAERLITREGSITVAGTVTNPGELKAVSVNGVSATLDQAGGFSVTLELAPGQNLISVSLPEEAGGAAVSRTVIYASAPPTLSVASPADSETTARPELVVSGSAMTSYGTPAIISVNGFVTPVDSAGGFSFPLSLRPGPTEVAVSARDQAGNSTTITRTVTYKPALPLISVTAPTDGFTTKESSVTVKGQVMTAVGLKSVTVNGAAASVSADGTFSASVNLEPGENAIAVVATDAVGGTSTANVRVLRGGLPPNLSVNSPADGLLTGAREVTVTGKASTIAGKIQSVTVNGAAAALSQDGTFLSKVTLPNGETTIDIVATDSFGTTSSVQRKVTVAADAPVVTILSPQDGTVSTRSSISVNGRVKASARIKSLSVNGQSVTPGSDGAFTATVTLQNGKNVITVSVTDILDRSASASRTVEYVNQPPQIDLSAPADGAQLETATIAVSGSVKVAQGLKLSSVSVNGVPVTAGATGGFSGSVRVEQPGEVSITVAATDSAGQRSSVTRTVSFVPKAPTLTVSSPSGDIQVASASFEVSGSAASNYGGLEVTVNGSKFNLGAGGGFSTTLTLNTGPNTITISAKDLYGVAPTITRTVTYSPPAPPPPTVQPTPVLSVSSGSAQYTDSLTLTGTLTLSGQPVSGKLLTFQVGGDAIGSATTNSSGVASLSYKVVKPAGTHTIAVAFAGDDSTVAVAGSGSLTVGREDATVTYTGTTTVTAGSLSLSATVAEVADGSTPESDKTRIGPVLFTVRSLTSTTPEFSQTVTVGSNGTAGPITATGLTGGPYVVEVGLAGSYYTAAPATASVQAGTAITVPTASGQYSDTVELKANLTPSAATNKLITFQLAGVTVGTALTDSSGTATLSYAIDKGAGSYGIKAIWDGDEAFSAATGTGTLVVSQENASLAYTGPAAVSASSTTMTLTAQLTPVDAPLVDPNLAGTVQFTLRSAGQTSALTTVTAAVNSSGQAEQEVTLLSPGPYEIDVTILSNSYYTAVTTTGTIKVITLLTPSFPTVEHSDPSSLYVMTNAGPGKEIIFTYDNQVVGTALTDSSGNATLSGIALSPAGDYTIQASFAGDAGYTAAVVTATNTVTAEKATLSYSGDLTTQGGTLNLAAALAQEADGSLGDLAAAGTVQFTVRGIDGSEHGTVTAAVNASGIATGTATISHAAYTIEVALQSKSRFDPATATATVKAVTSLAVLTATGTYSDPVLLSATLTPAVSGQEIAFTVGSVTVGTAVTDGSGVATLSYTITDSVGSPPLAASLSANTYYTAANGSAALQVGQEAGVLAYTGDLTTDGGPISLQAKLSESSDSSPGTISRGGTVLFTLTRPGSDSVVATYTATLDGSGVATTQTGTLNNEPFQVTASLVAGGDYLADPVTAVVQSVTTVTVSPQSVDFGDSVSLGAATSPALANKQIRFTIDGNPVGTGTADGSGTVSVPYVAALASGTYTLTAWFDGDSEYVAGSGSSTLTIGPEGATLAYLGDFVTVGGAISLSASLTPPSDGTGDAPAKGGQLQFIVTEIGGTEVGTFTASLSEMGTASTSTGSLPNQPYTVTVVLPQNGYYTATAVSATVQATTSLAVQSTAGEYSESVILSSTMTPAVAGKDVAFTVNGLAVGTATTDSAGVATLTYSLSTLASGTYSVDASFGGDSHYTASTGTGSLTVSPEQATLAYTGGHFVELDGSLALAAELTEGTGTTAGDLTKAGVVQFAIKSGGSTVQTLTAAVDSTGKAKVDASGLALQAYSVEVSLPAKDYFDASAVSFAVSSKSSVAVTAVQGQHADEVSLSATLTPAISGKEIRFTVGGSSAGTALTNGAGTATLTGYTLYQASGTYTIEATFYDDPDYKGSSSTNTLTVTPETATLTWTGSTTSTGGPLTLSAKLVQESDAAPGNISSAGTVRFVLTAHDQSHTFTASVGSDGTVSTTTGNLDPRNYSVSVSLDENGYFQADAISGSITTITFLSLSAVSGQFSDHVTFYVTGTYDGNDLTSGSATIQVSGLLPFNANVGGGTSWRIDRPAGTYDVSANFAGDGSAPAAVATSTLTVAAEDATLSFNGSTQSSSGSPGSLSASLTAEGDDLSFLSQPVTILFTVKDPNGNVVATTTATVGTNGSTNTGTIDFSTVGLPHGGYTVVTSLVSHSYFTAAADSDVIQAVTSLTVSPASGQYSDPVTLTAQLTPNVAGQTIQFLVDGGSVGTALTNASGTATLTYKIAVGNGSRTLKAVLAGDQYYMTASDTDTLTVSRETATLTYSGATVLNSSYTIDLEATWAEEADGSTGTDSRGSVTFTVSGSGTVQTYTASVDSTTGKATATTNPLTNQAYEVTLTAIDPVDYYDNIASATVTKVKALTTLSVPSATVAYSDPTILQATMSPTVSGRTLTFTIDGQTIGTGVTNESGIATLTYTVALPAGTYTVVASYDGDSTYGAATGGGTLTVSKEDNVSLSLARSFNFFPDSSQKALTLTATFSQQDGTPGTVYEAGVVELPVQFEVIYGGTAVASGTVTLDANGKATFTSPLIDAHTYTVKATLLTNNYYAPSSSVVTSTVNGPTTIDVTNISGVYSDGVALKAVVKVDSATHTGTTLTGLVFRINETALTGTKSTTNGVATYSDIAVTQTSGTHTITVTYPGSADYGAATGTGSLIVSAETATVTLGATSSTNLSSPGTVTVQASMNEDDNTSVGTIDVPVLFRVVNTQTSAEVASHTGSIRPGNTADWTTPSLPQGSYSITASLTESGYYLPTTSTAVGVTVQTPTSISVAQVTGQYSDSVVLQATLSPAASGKPIVFKVGSVVAGTGYTDASGVATTSYSIALDLTPNTHSNAIYASFAGDALYGASAGNGNLVVTSDDALITYTGEVVSESTITVTATVVDADTLGALAGDSDPWLTVQVFKQSDGLQIGSDTGYFLSAQSLNVENLDPNTAYTVKLSLITNLNRYVAATATATINVASLSLSSSGSLQFSDPVQLEALFSPVASGKEITFTVNSVTIASGNTNASGSVQTSWTPAALGSHTVTAQYTGGAHAPASATLSLSIAKETVTLTTTYTVSGLDVVVQGTMLDTDGTTDWSKAATATFTLNGVTQSAAFTGDTASYTFVGAATDTYTLNASLQSDYYTE